MVGNSKLVSYANLAAMIKAEVDFIALASKSYLGADILAAFDLNDAIEADYVAESDADKLEPERGSYRVFEDTTVIRGRKTSEPDVALHRVVVWSSARAVAAAKAREKKLERVRGDLERLSMGPWGDATIPPKERSSSASL